MYEKFLPKFKVVELNLSTAHLIGHVIAQTPAYVEAVTALSITATDTIPSVTKGDGYKFVENGVIVGLDAKGVLSSYDATKHSQPCLVYNDELITGPFDNLDQYAHYVEASSVNADGTRVHANPTYVRALPLYLNDAFTTNNVTDLTKDSTGAFAKVENGKLVLQSAADKDTLFIAKKTTLPNREVAFEFTYVGKVVNA